MTPQRIQLQRKKGWRMPENTVKVDRTTKYGNPHNVGFCRTCGVFHDTPEEAIEEFKEMVSDLPRDRFEELRAKNLACWCKPGQPCHADILLEIANQEID